VHRDAGCIVYDSRRRSGDSTVRHHIVVRPSEHRVIDPSGLADWLTGRWRAWTRRRSEYFAVRAQHEPWPLVDAELLELEENLLADAGLPPATQPPLVHFAAGVDVRLGWPRRVAPA